MAFRFLRQSIGDGLYEPEGLYLSAPFEGRQSVTQLWGENPHYYHRYSPGGVPLKGHNGVDFALSNGSRLLAVDEGKVIGIGKDPEGYGQFVKLAHEWGESLYAHMQGFTVESGQSVTREQLLGYSNNTGLTTKPHLHFAIRVYPYDQSDGWGGFTDPLPFIPPSAVVLPSRTFVEEQS